ncbi:MAG TPA: hypothetical protein VGH21_00770 [Solirubrobacteraceae bacterium]
MHLSHTISTALHRRARSAGVAMICVGLIALLAALPAVPAQASATSTPSIQLPVTTSSVPQSQLETLLKGLPLGELNATEVGKAVAELSTFGTLPTGKVQEAVTKVVETLAGEGKTLGTLLTPADVVSKLKSQLEGLLGLPKLLELLGGQDLKTLLTSALSTITPSQLLGTLLDNAAKPEQLVSKVLGAVDAGELEALLGSPLGGATFVPSTVDAFAGELGMTAESLANELGIEPVKLPPLSLALSGSLPDGKTLGVLDGLDGINLSLSSASGEQSGGGAGGSGEGGSGGGSGGAGGSGNGASGGPGGNGSSGSSAGTPSGTTVVVNYPAPSSTAVVGAGSAAAKIKIVNHKVKNGVATLVLQLPGAGNVALTGRGVHSVRSHVTSAGRMTVRTRLTKAKRSSHGRRRPANIKLTASFASSSGASSSASVTVRFAG